jgi:DNA-binding transcriptional LysR family regulator
VQSRCWGQGFEPEIVFETNGFDLCYKMCRERKGISVTVDFIHEDMKTDGLVMIPFQEKEMIWEIGLLTEKDQVMAPSVEQFCRFIENT